MKDFFIFLYELLHGVQDNPLWEDVYLISGILCLIISTICFCVFYYHVLNRYFIDWFKGWHWGLFMLLSGISNAMVSVVIAYWILEPLEFSSELLNFAFINFFYSSLSYSIFSLGICWGSPHAKYTPYKFFSNKKR